MIIAKRSMITARDRVIQTIHHVPPDRIPIDFAASRVTGIHGMTYNALSALLGIKSEGARIYDVPQMLAAPEQNMITHFKSDVVQLHRLVPAPAIGLRIDRFRKGTLPDGTRAYFPYDYRPQKDSEGNLFVSDEEGVPIYMMPKDGFYFSRIHNRLGHVESVKEIDDFDFHEFVPGEMAWLRSESKRLRETGFAVLGQFGGNFFERGNRLFGMEKFMIMLLAEEKMVHHFMERLTAAAIEDFDDYREAVEDRVDIIQLNDDLGSQGGPLISPDIYTKLVKPYQKRLYQHIRETTRMHLFLHSCGGIFEFIPHFIDIGVEILNPVQYTAKGMDPVRLKKEFGKDLTFWGGGCDAQKVLQQGTPAEVKKETAYMIDIFCPGGGFVFTQVHNLQPGTPPENIIAMFEVIAERNDDSTR
jgi:uroporphyrinogen decarboxylase